MAPDDVAGPELGGPARAQPAVDHRSGQQVEGDGHQAEADGQQGGGEEPVGAVGEGDGGDPDEPLGHGPEGARPGQLDGGGGGGRCGWPARWRRWRPRPPRRPRTPRVTRADRSEVASEAAWNSLRLTTRKTRTAPAMTDSSKSAPATRCNRTVPASSTTATRQARRWPRRMPRPRAMRARPATATRAPAASLARTGRNCSTVWRRPRSGGVMESIRSMTPVTRMAAAPQRRTRRVCRWAWRRSVAGGHESPTG